jgi:hypothetical protein
VHLLAAREGGAPANAHTTGLEMEGSHFQQTQRQHAFSAKAINPVPMETVVYFMRVAFYSFPNFTFPPTIN